MSIAVTDDAWRFDGAGLTFSLHKHDGDGVMLVARGDADGSALMVGPLADPKEARRTSAIAVSSRWRRVPGPAVAVDCRAPKDARVARFEGVVTPEFAGYLIARAADALMMAVDPSAVVRVSIERFVGDQLVRKAEPAPVAPAHRESAATPMKVAGRLLDEAPARRVPVHAEVTGLRGFKVIDDPSRAFRMSPALSGHLRDTFDMSDLLGPDHLEPVPTG